MKIITSINNIKLFCIEEEKLELNEVLNKISLKLDFNEDKTYVVYLNYPKVKEWYFSTRPSKIGEIFSNSIYKIKAKEDIILWAVQKYKMSEINIELIADSKQKKFIYKNSPLKVLNLENRIFNVLMRNKCETVESFMNLKIEDLSRMKGVGLYTIKEILQEQKEKLLYYDVLTEEEIRNRFVKKEDFTKFEGTEKQEVGVKDINENETMIIKQEGLFYGVSNNDALLLKKYLNYKTYGIKKIKTGFPIYLRDLVLQKIDKLNINYDIIDKNKKVIISQRFPVNKYEIVTSFEDFSKNKKIEKKNKFERFIFLLKALEDSCNPFTGEVINNIDEDLKEKISEIKYYFEQKLKSRQEKKVKTPKHGKRWSKEEDEELINEYKKGKTIEELSSLFQRSSRAISSRLLNFLNF